MTCAAAVRPQCQSSFSFSFFPHFGLYLGLAVPSVGPAISSYVWWTRKQGFGYALFLPGGSACNNAWTKLQIGIGGEPLAGGPGGCLPGYRATTRSSSKTNGGSRASVEPKCSLHVQKQ